VQFSTSIEYAIHGLVYLAGTGTAGAVMVSEIAEATRIPQSYLRKVLQLLARGGLVASHRGVRGGFSLARDARSITLQHVVEAIDGGLPSYSCVKEKRRCMDIPCPVSAAFETARRKMGEALSKTTIGGLAGSVSKRPDDWLAVTAGHESQGVRYARKG
jgi:Rrf2 family protein